MQERPARGRVFGRWPGTLRPAAALAAGRGENWRLDYLFSIGRVSWIIHLCVTALAGIVMRYVDPQGWIAIWVVSMAFLSAMMSVVATLYFRRGARASPEAYGIAHSGLTVAIGLAWGVGALLCARSASAEMLTFYTLVLGGTALGAVSSQHMLMRSCLLSIWTSVPLLAFAWLVNGVAPGPLATAVMMMLFGLILTLLASRMNAFLIQNAMLVDELAARNAVLSRTSARLAEAQEEKSRFLAQASHDLRQPIHAIGLLVEYLHGTRMGRDGREVLSNIDRSLASLTRLCRSLLDLAALDVGRVKPDIGPVSLAEVLGEVVRQAQEPARARNVDIRLRPSRLWVRSDAALLHTMVQNLVSNAIKYAPGARVLVGVRRRGGALSIVVADRGPGIDHADQQRIFKEFVQIEGSEGAEADGLGLGLSIVGRLAEMLGLRIGLVSRPGEGSTFSIDGLAEVRPATSSRSPRPASPLHLLANQRILVVDDDRAVRSSTVHLLSRWRCIVRATDRVTPALDPDEFDFLLVDQELAQGATGLSLIRDIRARSSDWKPAAIITGARADHLVGECRAEEIEILAKPVRPAQLRSVLLAGLAARADRSQGRSRSIELGSRGERGAAPNRGLAAAPGDPTRKDRDTG